MIIYFLLENYPIIMDKIYNQNKLQYKMKKCIFSFLLDLFCVSTVNVYLFLFIEFGTLTHWFVQLLIVITDIAEMQTDKMNTRVTSILC